MNQQNNYNQSFGNNQNNQYKTKEKPRESIDGEYIDYEEL